MILISHSFHIFFSNEPDKVFAYSGATPENASVKEKFFYACSGGDDDANIELIIELLSNDPCKF